MEVRRIDIRCSREPAAGAAEIQPAEEVHEYGGCNNDRDACEVVRSGCWRTQRVPGFSKVINERRVEEEQRLSTATSKIRSPSGQQHAIAHVFVELHQSRYIRECVMPGKQAASQEWNTHRDR